MKFLRFYQKRNKILSVRGKVKSLNIAEGQQLSKEAQQGCFPMNIQRVLGTAFLNGCF